PLPRLEQETPVDQKRPGRPEVLVVGAPAGLPVLRHEIVLQRESGRQTDDRIVLIHRTTAAGHPVSRRPVDVAAPVHRQTARAPEPAPGTCCLVNGEGSGAAVRHSAHPAVIGAAVAETTPKWALA